ncbi:MAG: long-chain fatty acid--CoA ligase [Thermodesulfobacteriota bacterium]|nr:long-chain fatty acid--CoA ligase [Thermodesulfobacteriota bacterium]
MNELWHNSYPFEIPPKIDYHREPLFSFLENSANNFPDKIAVRYYGLKLSYRKLKRCTEKFAGSLSDLGVKKGDRIALVFPNSPQMIITLYAAFKLGFIAVPVNPLYTEREMEWQIKNSDAQVIITFEKFFKKIEKIKINLNISKIIISKIYDFLPFYLIPPLYIKERRSRNSRVTKGKDIYFFKELIRKGRPKKSMDVVQEDIALLQYTGGTTGLPKGVILTHRNLVSNVLQTAHWFYESKKGSEIILSVIPFFHIFGLTVALNFPIFLAATIILAPGFELINILKMISKYQPTLFPGTPAMFSAISRHRQISKYNLTSIQFCISGSAPLTKKVQQDFTRVTGSKLVEGFGLTESSPVTHCNPFNGRDKEGSIGLPVPDTMCKIVDIETGEKVLGIEEEGELCIKGPQVMEGYMKSELETQKVLKNGWLYTGDIARMDKDGYFYIVDRKKDLILSGGYNIYPQEVDEILCLHPEIKEAATIGIPDRLRGEKVVAFIVTGSDVKIDKKKILKYCRERLAKYKIPSEIKIVRELPKSSIGKILRKDIRKEYLKNCKELED